MSPLLLPALPSKQVPEIPHFLRMGRLDLIGLKGQDNTLPILRISSDGWYCIGRGEDIQQRIERKPSGTGNFVWSNILQYYSNFLLQ